MVKALYKMRLPCALNALHTNQLLIAKFITNNSHLLKNHFFAKSVLKNITFKMVDTFVSKDKIFKRTVKLT